jgi:branched-chain amino acid transport system substrate-binding protein
MVPARTIGERVAPAEHQGRNMQKKMTSRVAAILLGFTLVAAACGGDDSEEGAAGTETTAAEETTETTAAEETTETTEAGAEGGALPEACADAKVAFLGALSGDNGALGTNMVNGAQVGFANAGVPDVFPDDLHFDSQGAPEQATPLADEIVNNENVIALIGPGFSGETAATMPSIDGAGLVMITPGATRADLSQQGWDSFHRVLANDDKQAPGVVQLITGTIGGTAVGVIDDASPYGEGLALSVKAGLEEAGILVAESTITAGAPPYTSAIDAMVAGGVDTVFFSGYFSDAALLVSQMRDAGVEATFVSGDGSLDPAFIEGAGAAAEGAYLTATGAPSDVDADFATAFEEMHGTEPRLYSPEAYDIANVFIQGMLAGNCDRASMLEWVNGYDGAGITKQITFDEGGEPTGDAVFYWIVEGGELASKGIIPA